MKINIAFVFGLTASRTKWQRTYAWGFCLHAKATKKSHKMLSICLMHCLNWSPLNVRNMVVEREKDKNISTDIEYQIEINFKCVSREIASFSQQWNS